MKPGVSEYLLQYLDNVVAVKVFTKLLEPTFVERNKLKVISNGGYVSD